MSQVLLVCTGNICRSPLAEALLVRELKSRGIENVEAVSAGAPVSVVVGEDNASPSG